MLENTTSNLGCNYYGYTHIWVPGCLLPLWKWLFCKRGIHLFDEVISYWGKGTEKTGPARDGWHHRFCCDACQLEVYIDDREIPQKT